MASFKSIVVPALVAIFLYTVITFVLVPLWRRHRARYAQYMPVHLQQLDLEHLSTSTSTLRQRLKEALVSFLLPFRRDVRSVAGHSPTDFDTNDEDLEDEIGGENLSQLSQIMHARREALEERRREVERRQRVDSSDRRLSRDLEQGFADSSDEEERNEVEGRGVQERWRNG